MIALAYANGGRSGGLVAPFGGAERRMGTNPIAVAIPLKDRPAMLLDFATSAVAEGKVRVAFNSGKEIPEGWALDKNGAPTKNPGDVYEGGIAASGSRAQGIRSGPFDRLFGRDINWGRRAGHTRLDPGQTASCSFF